MTTLEITPNSLFSSALWLHLSKTQFIFLIFVLETCRCVTVYKQLLFTKLNVRKVRKVFTSWLVDLLYWASADFVPNRHDCVKPMVLGSSVCCTYGKPMIVCSARVYPLVTGITRDEMSYPCNKRVSSVRLDLHSNETTPSNMQSLSLNLYSGTVVSK